jgi:DNA-binding beta-propeller fold protein YncE
LVSNVLTGTVTRVMLTFKKSGVTDTLTQIASGYTHTPDPNALEIGPTGLAYNAATDTLYVASTGDNEVFAIPHASTTTDKGTGKVIDQDTTHLHGPLGLVIAPNGDLIVANGDAVNADPNQLNELVEFTPTGQFVTQFQLDTSSGGGAAFGIALATVNGEVRFAAVDDATNTVDVWTLEQGGSPASGPQAHTAIRVDEFIHGLRQLLSGNSSRHDQFDSGFFGRETW